MGARFDSAIRLFHTARFLKPVQIYGRVWHAIRSVRPDTSPSPALREMPGQWCSPVSSERTFFDGWRFRFLNIDHHLVIPEDWDLVSIEKLWLYNLHYFSDLNAMDAMDRRAIHGEWIQRWITEVPAGRGVGWEPYPLSLRIVNWTKWILSGGDRFAEMHQSLAVQARYLRRCPEVHLLGNHLFENAKALTFAGIFFNGDEAADWLKKGIEILKGQIHAQILPDGGHFELSPMYHAQILEGVLDLINLDRTSGGLISRAMGDLDLARIASRMLIWLNEMRHPDGDISFFNDATLGVAPTYYQLTSYAQLLGISVLCKSRQNSDAPSIFHLPDSGYIRVDWADATAILDASRIGPDYLPAHAHADSLSFELSLHGQRAIVNSGTSCYGTSAERLRQRGTAAHNTVVVDGENSSEVWGGFRVARRAYPMGIRTQQVANGLEIQCTHTGYRRLPGKVLHQRSWLCEQNGLTVHDQLSGKFKYAEANFHFHPEIHVVSVGERIFHLLCGDSRLMLMEIGDCLAATAAVSTWHPGFGLAISNQRITIRFLGNSLTTRFSW